MTAARGVAGRSAIGTAALVFAALSAIALVIMVVASVAGVEGFTSDNTSSAAADASWLCFSLGALLALTLGIISWVRGARRGPAEDVRAGKIAVGYFVLALIVTAVSAALTNS